MNDTILDEKQYKYGEHLIMPRLGDIDGVDNGLRTHNIRALRNSNVLYAEIENVLAQYPIDPYDISTWKHPSLSITLQLCTSIMKKKHYLLVNNEDVMDDRKLISRSETYVPFNPDSEPYDVRYYVNSVLHIPTDPVDDEVISDVSIEMVNVLFNVVQVIFSNGFSPKDMNDLIASFSKTWIMNEDYRDVTMSILYCMNILLNMINRVLEETLLDSLHNGSVEEGINDVLDNISSIMESVQEKLSQASQHDAPIMLNRLQEALNYERHIDVFYSVLVYLIDIILYKS